MTISPETIYAHIYAYPRRELRKLLVQIGYALSNRLCLRSFGATSSPTIDSRLGDSAAYPSRVA
jgi:hypothetical protein